jgi:hypothetical protein
MRRDEIAAALRRAAAWPTRERARRAWSWCRARPEAVLAFALWAGVLTMVLHWM